MLFISSAYAQDAAAAASQNAGMGSFVPLVLIVLVFYFMIIRPQQKKMKEHTQMVEALRRGDKVLTSGGILGTVKKVDNDADVLQVEIAPDVVVRVMRHTITDVLTRSAPADSTKTPDKKEEKSTKPKKAANEG